MKVSVQSLFDRRDSPIRVLLVEDSRRDADFVAMLLRHSPEIVVDIDHVTSLSEAVGASLRCDYDIVILDLELPDCPGTESVSRLHDCCPNTPIVVLTGDDRNTTAFAAIESGAHDYLPKQHIAGQLLARKMQFSIVRHFQLIQAQSEALVDGLTGIANRRACEAELDRRISDFERHSHPFCAALFDIDHFKRVNDRWGHEAGDQVIRAVAEALVSNARKSDHVARYGGEEFAVIFPITRLPEAQEVVLRCHRAISQLVVGHQRLHVTVSVGLAEITDQEDGRSLFSHADEALYAAKGAGRNKCMLHCGGKVIGGSRRSQLAGATAGSW